MVPDIDGFFFGILNDSFLSFFIFLTSVIFFSSILISLFFLGFFIGFRIFLDNLFASSSFVRVGFFKGINTDVSAERLLESICSDLVDTKLDVEYLSWDVHKVFYGRVNALRRAISNVIENAVKYGDKAYVQMELKQDEVQIKVKDCGPGIPEVEMEKVFAPFYRVDPARNPEKGGSGLGLAVSRDIIRSHAGDVKLYNSDEPGMGLVVVMHLPVSD